MNAPYANVLAAAAVALVGTVARRVRDRRRALRFADRVLAFAAAHDAVVVAALRCGCLGFSPLCARTRLLRAYAAPRNFTARSGLVRYCDFTWTADLASAALERDGVAHVARASGLPVRSRLMTLLGRPFDNRAALNTYIFAARVVSELQRGRP